VRPASALVLFDIDGTLLRGAGSHHKEALLEGVRRVTGLSASFEGIDTAGKLDMDLIAALLKSAGAAGDVCEIARECQRAYLENCPHDLGPFVCKGARDLLTGLAERGAAMALVTGNLSAIGWRKMELAGLREFFRCGAFSEDGAARAQLARIAVTRAREQCHAADDCGICLIGDHRNDVEAAQANGIRAVAVASGPMAADELRNSQPDIFIECLADLNIDLLLETAP
jgi:phosphoglycolate phosphatase-like HAD superfamily hydrolase